MAPWPEAPDIKVTTLSYVMSLMPPSIQRDLGLERFGYKVYPQGHGLPAASRRLDPAVGRRAPGITPRSRGSPSTTPISGPKFEAWIGRIANIMGPLLMETPPHVGSKKAGDIKDVAQLGWQLRKEIDQQTVADITRLFTMSATDLLRRWFENEVFIGLQSVNGIIGTWAGPDAPGTAYVLMHHSVGDIGDGEIASWGYPEGGMGAVGDACASAAQSFGAEIRTNARVERVLVRDGRAIGVALDGGEELSAPLVVTAIHPKITFLEQIERSQLPDDVRGGHRELAHALGHGEDQPGARRAPGVHRRPGLRPGHPRRRDPGARRPGLPGEGVPGGAVRAGGDAAVQRHGDPHGVRQDAGTGGRPRHVDVHAVGAGRSGRTRTGTRRTSRRTPTG